MSNTNTFLVEEVISAACSAHRLNNGFIKSQAFDMKEGQVPNSKLLYRHFLGAFDKKQNKNVRQLLTITDADKNLAAEIIDYLKGLSFKAMERDLTDFESNVLKLVSADSIDKSQIGIASSLPKVYYNKQKQDDWATREQDLARKSEYVGTVGKRSNFFVKVENIRHISSVGSNLYCTTVRDTSNIVKFFGNADINVGDTVELGAYVKGQTVSDYHGGKETMVNRIKIISEK